MKRLIYAALITTVLISHASEATALFCGPDGWYEVRFRVDQSSLPEGVVFHTELANGVDQVYIQNSTSTPLYLLNYKYQHKGKITELDLAIDGKYQGSWREYYKVVDGTAYQYPWNGWEPIDRAYNEGKGFGIPRLGSWESAFNIELKQVYQDNRPKKVDIPQPHEFEIPAYFGSQLTPITGFVEYSLNKNYDRKQGHRCTMSAWQLRTGLTKPSILERLRFMAFQIWGKLI